MLTISSSHYGCLWTRNLCARLTDCSASHSPSHHCKEPEVPELEDTQVPLARSNKFKENPQKLEGSSLQAEISLGSPRQSSHHPARRVESRSSTVSSSRPRITISCSSSVSEKHTKSRKSCDECGVLEGVPYGLWYCNVCRFIFCNICWDDQLPHRRDQLGPGGIPHEKTELDVAEKVSNVLSPLVPDLEREKLCYNDEATAWFGKHHASLT